MLMLGTIAFAIVPCDGKYMTSYLMAIVMFVLTLTIYEIYAKQYAESFALKMKVKVKEKNGKKTRFSTAELANNFGRQATLEKGCFITTRHSTRLIIKSSLAATLMTFQTDAKANPHCQNTLC